MFPPFPGDSVVLLGGIYAVRGQRSWALVLLAVTVGSVLGAAVVYGVGRRIGDAVDHGRLARLRPVQEQMKKRGTWLLLANRFMPGVRALIFLAAGAAHLPLRRTLVLGAVSALVFNSGVLGAGFALGGNAEQLEAAFARYQAVVYVLLSLLALGIAIRFALGRRRDEPPGEQT